MKRFAFVADQALTELDGSAIKDDAGSPITWTQYSWLCGRVSDPQFVGSRPGIEGLAFAIATQQELAEQRAAAEQRGFWLVEDDRAAALLHCTLQPTGGYVTRFALVTILFARAVEKMLPFEPKPES